MISKTIMASLVALAMSATFACKSEDSGAEDKAAKAKDESKPAAERKQKKARRKERAKKDRGEASMKIGDELWEAKGAKAKLRNSSLRIDASRMDMVGKKASRQQLIMIIPDYKGPGTYQVRPAGSMFVGVGFNTDKLKAADTDEKVAGETMKAVNKAKTIMLLKTTVVIESANEKQVVGTFSQPALGKRFPALSEGSFRAVMKNKK